MAARKKPYTEGCWIAVPLPDHGGYALGVIARAKSGVLVGYFFAPRHAQVPSLEAARRMTPEKAILIERFGDMGLLKGEWPILGCLPEWDRAKWPIPLFFSESLGSFCLVQYADDDPTAAGVIKRISATMREANRYFEDGLAGHIALSVALDRTLHEREHDVIRLRAATAPPANAKDAL